MSAHENTRTNMFPEDSDTFVFVDIQGFRAECPTFILKEFCLIDGDNVFHHIVNSPFNFTKLSETYKKQARFLTKYHHGIGFDCGDITARQLIKEIFPRLENKIVLVKGLQKVAWLKKLFKNEGQIICKNIEDIISNWEEKKQEQYRVCQYHDSLHRWNSDICAMSIAFKIQENWNSHSVSIHSPVNSVEVKNELVA